VCTGSLCMYVCMYVCMYRKLPGGDTAFGSSHGTMKAPMCVYYMCVCMFVYVYVYVYVCMYI
jgi:hypothetical protein